MRRSFRLSLSGLRSSYRRIQKRARIVFDRNFSGISSQLKPHFLNYALAVNLRTAFTYRCPVFPFSILSSHK